MILLNLLNKWNYYTKFEYVTNEKKMRIYLLPIAGFLLGLISLLFTGTGTLRTEMQIFILHLVKYLFTMLSFNIFYGIKHFK
jgi:fatty-acid desaturase